MTYHLKYWGGVQNDNLSANFLGTTETDFWFYTLQERNIFKNNLLQFAKLHKQMVCFDEHEGIEAETRTVAVMVLEYKGKQYPLEYDFGVGYPAESALYMWEEGNYACDCNRALFLHKQYPEFEEDFKCTADIDMLSIVVELRQI